MFSEIMQSVILGIVQGLGEFLPISSTAHLVMLPYLGGFKDPGLAFDVALHVGTLIAVVGFFWKDWIEVIANAVLRKETSRYPKNIFWFLVAATLPGVAAGYFLEDKAETVFRSPVLIAGALFIFGLMLYAADRYVSAKKNMGKISLRDALIIGAAQAVAIIPGVSRSGATITAGRLLGLDRMSAARFSFLLSTPIIFGASCLKLRYFLANSPNALLWLGVLCSAISGFIAIKYLLKFVARYSYAVFFWYRSLLAAAILAFYYLT